MAIVIPSKRIYDISNNDKINKNRISTVSADENVCNILNGINENIYTYSNNRIICDTGSTQIIKGFSGESVNLPWWTVIDCDIQQYGDGMRIYSGVCSTGLRSSYFTIPEIKIYKKQNNNKTTITKVNIGKNAKGENNINYSVKYKVYKHICSLSGQYIVHSPMIYGNFVLTTSSEYEESDITENNYIKNNVSDTIIYTWQSQSHTLNAECEVADLTNIGNENIQFVENDEYFQINNLTVNTRSIYYTAKAYDVRTIPYSTSGSTITYQFDPVAGEYYEYIPQTLEITFNGNKFEYEFDTNAVVYDGDDGYSKNTYKLDTNELMQQDTKVVISEDDEEKITQNIASKILNEYSDGKEVAEIRCSINDYYDTEGNKVIDISNSNKMTFSVGDIVIPYRNVPNVSQEPPISYYRNGQPKQFLVTGVGIEFDGALWQKLQLQEVKSNT